MLKSFKTEINPTIEQKDKINKTIGTCRYIYNFYLGYTGKAVTQLILDIVGILLAALVVGFFIIFGVSIWQLVEGIMLLTGKISVDGKGIPLKD